MREFRRKEVIIVAGPSASGKTYLMRQLMTKKKNKFKDTLYCKLGINPRKARSGISISAVKNLRKKPEHSRKLKKRVIFIHFDLTSRNQEEKRELLLRIAKSCKKIKVITIKTQFRTWQERMENRFNTDSPSNPSNDATNIYKNSKNIPILAKLQYKLVYIRWSNYLNKINPETKVSVNN